MRSYFRNLIEEKGLIHENIVLSHSGKLHLIPMDTLIETMESASLEDRKFLRNNLMQLDFINADIMEFLRMTALTYLTAIEAPEETNKVILKKAY